MRFLCQKWLSDSIAAIMADFQFLRSAEMLHIKGKLLLLEIKRKVKNPAQMQSMQTNFRLLSLF
jgi:hypothetical protein